MYVEKERRLGTRFSLTVEADVEKSTWMSQRQQKNSTKLQSKQNTYFSPFDAEDKSLGIQKYLNY